MKPNFALSLSSDGIRLLHRAAGGWRDVGDVSLASEDLSAELAILRKTAVSLEPGGLRSKLIIPSSQIKYLSIETPGLSAEARRKEAAKALENATPYAVEDLSFDISQEGPLTHVAAVARETLAEAQAFAEEHRFHPVSFVAIPDDAPYLGEPFFGTVSGVETLLEPGETVEPDGIAVVVIGAVEKLDEDAPEAVDDTAAPDPETSVDAPAPDAAEPTEADTAEQAEPATAAEPAKPQPVAKTADAASGDAPERVAEPVAPPAAEADGELLQRPQAVSKPAPEETKPATTAGPSSRSDPADRLAVNATAPSVPSADIPPAQQPEPVAPAPSKPTFSAARKASAAPVAAAAPASAAGFASRRGTTPPLGGASREAPGPDSSSLTQAPLTDPAPAEKPKAKAGFLSRRKPRKGAAAPVPAPAPAVRAATSESERMTVFGARSSEVGGKPRFLGLIMTVILLVFLAGVAAWAAVFLDDGLAGLLRRDDSRAIASAPENQIAPEVIRLPDDSQDASTPTAQGTQVAALDPVLSAEETAARDGLTEPRPEPVQPVITEQQAAARYAVSGIWPLAPTSVPERPQVDTSPVFQIGIDPLGGSSDAIALPSPDGYDTDTVLAALPSPPPFGQTTVTDENGLTVPTPTGVVAPGGYTLIAASPPVKPPQAPTRVTETEDSAEAAASTPVLAGFRPTPRPSGLVETTERARLGGVSRSELAAFRPSLRPRSVQEDATRAAEAAEAARKADDDARAEAAAAAAASAAVAALAAPAPAPSAPAAAVFENATRLATAQSRRPDTRPRNFARIVKRAERARPREETRVAAAATVAPRTVAPKIPSKASVARSATVKNAINLRRVNLIGVYGKPSSRRALVRLANGRYKKVRVGDRIDGGRVSAIGNSELRYTKGGRNVVLKMPRG